MKRTLLKNWAKAKDAWSSITDDDHFSKENNRKLAKQFSDDLMILPLTSRLEVLKKVNREVLEGSRQQEQDFRDAAQHWKEGLDKFRI